MSAAESFFFLHVDKIYVENLIVYWGFILLVKVIGLEMGFI